MPKPIVTTTLTAALIALGGAGVVFADGARIGTSDHLCRHVANGGTKAMKSSDGPLFRNSCTRRMVQPMRETSP